MLILGKEIYYNERLMSVEEYKEEIFFEKIEKSETNKEIEDMIYQIEAEYALGYIDDREYHNLKQCVVDEYHEARLY